MTVEELQVKISAEIDDLKRGCEGAKQQMNQVSVTANKMGDAIKSAFSVAKVLAFIAAIQKVSIECTKAYTTQFNAEQKLTTAMRANLNATDDQITSVKKLASAQQELGIVGDEVQLAGIAQLSMYKMEISSIEKLVPAMNDLIVAKDGLNASVGTATDMGKMFAETLNGQADSLKEVGIYFTDAEKQILQYGSEADKVNLIIQKVNKTVGNMNTNMANTPLGQVQQLKNLFGDIQEQIGQIASNLSATVVPVLSDILSWVSEILDYAVAFSEVFYEVFGGTKIKVDKNKSGVDNLADSISSVKEEAVEAKKALYALAGFDELNILKDNKTSGTKTDNTSTDDNDQNTNNSSVTVSISANAELAKQNIKDIIAELQKSLEGLDINVNTDEAQQKLDDFKNKWTERLKEFLAIVEADPDNAVKEFIKLQDEFNNDYSQLVTEVEADTTDGGKALKDFKVYWDNQLGQLKINVVVATDNVQKTDAELALNNIKNIVSDLQDELFNLDLHLSTDEANKTLRDYQNTWADMLDAFYIDIEADPSNADKKFAELKQNFLDSYDTFVTQVGADTTDAGESIKDFRSRLENDFFNKFAINVTVIASANTDPAEERIKEFKNWLYGQFHNVQIYFTATVQGQELIESLTKMINSLKRAAEEAGKYLAFVFGKLDENDSDPKGSNTVDVIIALSDAVTALTDALGDLFEMLQSGILGKAYKFMGDILSSGLKDILNDVKMVGKLLSAVFKSIGEGSLKPLMEYFAETKKYTDDYTESNIKNADAATRLKNGIFSVINPMYGFSGAVKAAVSAISKATSGQSDYTDKVKDTKDQLKGTKEFDSYIDKVNHMNDACKNGTASIIDFTDSYFKQTETMSDNSSLLLYDDTVNTINDSIIEATNSINNQETALGSYKEAQDNATESLDVFNNLCYTYTDKVDKIKDSTSKYTVSILDQVEALRQLKEALTEAGRANSIFDTSYTYADTHGPNGRLMSPLNSTISMPNKNTAPKANATTNNSYTTNYSNSKTSNVSQVFNNTSKDNTKDIVDAIDKLGRDIDESNKNNRTVIGDEDIARSANRGNNRMKNRAASYADSLTY